MQYYLDYSKEQQYILPLLRDLVGKNELSEKALRSLLSKYPSQDGDFYSKGELRTSFVHFIKTGQITLPSEKQTQILALLQMKKTRSISGVTPITVFTKPYPCPGACIFCPTSIHAPKSYLESEPGVQRAIRHSYDPYMQTKQRITALKNIGHPISKIELIVLGGTWSAYTKSYQAWFVRRCMEALCNDTKSLELMVYENSFEKEIQTIKILQKLNETSNTKLVGFVVETRPDRIQTQELVRMRKLGITKIQIGIQSTDDQILALNKRGHTLAQVETALDLIRQFGFKSHVHFMPNLYGSTVQKDIDGYSSLFANPHLLPDEIKIYPCMLIPKTELMTMYQAHTWKPYTDDELQKVLLQCYLNTPEYCRISRMVRDIPKQEIHDGSTISNFRQYVENEIVKKKYPCREIRFREIRDGFIDSTQAKISDYTYLTHVSEEHFLQITVNNHTLLGFLRLSLPKMTAPLQELSNHAIIRELHIYGPSTPVGDHHAHKTQHKGFGSKLLELAFQISKNQNFMDIAIISAVGTRSYYRKFGFVDGELYQHKHLQ